MVSAVSATIAWPCASHSSPSSCMMAIRAVIDEAGVTYSRVW